MKYIFGDAVLPPRLLRQGAAVHAAPPPVTPLTLSVVCFARAADGSVRTGGKSEPAAAASRRRCGRLKAC